MHKWKNSVFSEEDILDEFMPQTRREVVEHILGEVVGQVAMFKYVDNSDYLTEVTLKFRPVATGNFDTPIQAFGDKGPDIFVVIRGHVNLLDEQGEVLGVAGKGTAIFENELISSLGEDESLDCPWKYCAPYSIVPSPNGEVFTLRRPDFINILRRYPKVREDPKTQNPKLGTLSISSVARSKVYLAGCTVYLARCTVNLAGCTVYRLEARYTLPDARYNLSEYHDTPHLPCLK